MLCVIPLLTSMLGYLLLYLPQVNRALWRSATLQAQLIPAAAAGHHYPAAAADATGITMVALPLTGSLHIATGLARQLTALGRRWSAGSPASPATAAGLAVLTGLAAFWTTQAKSRSW